MRISRLYLPCPLQSGQQLTLDAHTAHYIRTVLRLDKGDDLIVFNGAGGEFSASILLCTKQEVMVNISVWNDKDVESKLQTHLGLAISRAERMDYALQKAVELGVTQITPLLTERCVVKLKADNRQQKLQHWRGIVQSACEQSGRTCLPEVAEPQNLAAWLNEQQGLRILLHPFATKTLQKINPENSQVTLLSGPEGGFSEAERDLAVRSGFSAVSLGPRVLRTETAALAALAAIQTLWGDFV